MINNKQKGFGLIEVIVSLGLITSVVLALNYLSQLSSKAWETANNKTIAYGIVQSKMEEIKNLRDLNIYNGLKFDDSFDDNKFDNDNYSLESVPAKKFKIDVNFLPEKVNLAGVDREDLNKKVIISVSWGERSGERKLESVSYLTDWRNKY